MFDKGQKALSVICSFLQCNKYHFLKPIIPSQLPANFFSSYTYDRDVVHDCAKTRSGYSEGSHQSFHSERNSSVQQGFSYSSSGNSASTNNSTVTDAEKIQDLMKIHQCPSELESALEQPEISLTEDLVIEVLRRNQSNWKSALFFFTCVQNRQGYSHGARAYNQMVDILGKLKQFKLMRKLVEEIPLERRGLLVTERTFSILLNRYAGGHKVEEVIDMFCKRKDFGLELDKVAFQTLLMSLCRYKHVEVAESLFHLKSKEFPPDIKSKNIILNGWCVAGRLHEAKRFWNDIIRSGCKPDLFTYGIFINALAKAGKLGSAVKLFTSMWEKGHSPDVAICNCIIDALCFKKKIPDALVIFREMNEKGCVPDTATYNSLIKHLCKIGRMDEAYKLLDEMEQKGCHPNARTYNYFLKSTEKPEEVPQLLQRMETFCCRLTGDTYNLVLKLYIDWGHQEGVQFIWNQMEKFGLGPDQRSYTIMVHGLYKKGRINEALHYFKEMISRGLIPEPRTKILVKAIELRRETKDGSDSSTRPKNRERYNSIPS